MFGIPSITSFVPLTFLIDSLFGFVLTALFVPSILSFSIASFNNLLTLLSMTFGAAAPGG